jgi:hypothetical protein
MTLSDFARTSWMATMSKVRTTRASTSTTCGLASFASPNTWMLKLAISTASDGLAVGGAESTAGAEAAGGPAGSGPAGGGGDAGGMAVTGRNAAAAAGA